MHPYNYNMFSLIRRLSTIKSLGLEVYLTQSFSFIVDIKNRTLCYNEIGQTHMVGCTKIESWNLTSDQ